MKTKKRYLNGFIPALVFIAIAAVSVFAIFAVGGTSESEAAKITENNIRRAVITCYSLEGSYPRDLEYLKENYGLSVSDDFVVYYDIFASNIMPDITVLKKD